MRFEDHVYTDCNHLKQLKDGGRKSDYDKRKHSYAREARYDYNDNDNDDIDNIDEREATVFTAQYQHEKPVSDWALATYPVLPNTKKWIFDSGCSMHMSSFKTDFVDVMPHKGFVSVAGGHRYTVENIGTVELKMLLPNGSVKPAVLTKALYIPAMKNTRLFSWKEAAKHGHHLYGHGDNVFCLLKGKAKLWAKITANGIVIQTQDMTTKDVAMAASFTEFHASIGHATTKREHYADPENVPVKPSSFHCTICAKAKSSHSKPASTEKRASEPFALIHSDLSSKFSTPSLGGSNYYVSFIDDYTRMTWVYFMKNKSDFKEILVRFLAMVLRQYGARIKRFRSDRGGEYIDGYAQDMMKKEGIIWEPSPAYLHESNGVAERFNRTIATMARSLIMSQGLPKYLWAEAIATAVYLKNRLPHSTVNMTPYEAFHGTRPSLKHLHLFGQRCYVHIPKEARAPTTKFEPRAMDAIFIGYTASSKIYRVYNPSKRSIKEVRDITFVLWTPPTSYTSGGVQIERNCQPPAQTPLLI